jgi:hypothetical protein
MEHIVASRTFSLFVFAFLLLGVNVSSARKPEHLVKPCPKASRAVPIARACVAAAIAEEAFLRATQHKITQYVISYYEPSKPKWHIWIREGDETHPGADGAFWQIYVERASGEVELVPGR